MEILEIIALVQLQVYILATALILASFFGWVLREIFWEKVTFIYLKNKRLKRINSYLLHTDERSES